MDNDNMMTKKKPEVIGESHDAPMPVTHNDMQHKILSWSMKQKGREKQHCQRWQKQDTLQVDYASMAPGNITAARDQQEISLVHSTVRTTQTQLIPKCNPV